MTSRSTVLIVDDMPAIHQMIAALLRGDSFHLEHAYSGLEALEVAAAVVPDLVLLDVMLPDIDGFEVCQRLRSSPGISEVPVIMITALSDRSSRLRGIEAGADDFVSKPFDQVELRSRIRTIVRLDRSRKLLAERARFERLVELAPDGILIVDLVGTVHLANPALLQMLAMADQSAINGQSFDAFVHRNKRDQWHVLLQENGVAVGTPAAAELTLVSACGDQVPVEMTAGVVTWENAPAVQLVVRDITWRKSAELALKQQNRELRALAQRISSVQEQERQALAREIHDRIGQNLTAIHLNLAIVSQELAGEPPALVARLNDSSVLLEETARQLRDVMSELRPSMLDDYGLVASLRWYLDQFQARSGIESRLDSSQLPDQRLPAEVELALFRVCQEALTNITKHAKASAVEVSLLRRGEEVVLTVTDDGEGFNVDRAVDPAGEARWGLFSMRERINAVGGVYRVDSMPGKGTVVKARVIVPLTEFAYSADLTVPGSLL